VICARVPEPEGDHPPGVPGDPDRAVVALQLGREPRGGWRVARRCACGLPQVIETEPRLDDGTPFPTLWWLTCRTLCSAVGRLEANGWMAAVNRSLEEDPERRAELARAVARYVEARDAHEVLPGKGHPGGGPDRVKCLHAHVAQELAGGGNPVGRAALDELGWSDPIRSCVATAGAGEARGTRSAASGESDVP
jgi:hypothetical protein